MPKTYKTHPRDQSLLYKISNYIQLANRLSLTREELDELLVKPNEKYSRRTQVTRGKRTRFIKEPKDLLAVAHKRVGVLLQRIEVPSFLYSGIKGRSYIDNALQHDPEQPTVKIDIRKFYDTAERHAVFCFFHHRMMCAKDIADILAKLLTADKHLATGSSASVILSYYAYENMFNEINDLAKSKHCEMTCYIDDMIFTGRGATGDLIYQIKKILHRYGLYGHKIEMFQSRQAKIITGVKITPNGPRVPESLQRSIRRGRYCLKKERNGIEQLKIARSLAGSLHAAAQVDPSRWKSAAMNVEAHKQALDKQLPIQRITHNRRRRKKRPPLKLFR